MSPSTSPSNGRRPVIAAKVHAPSDQRSVSGPGAPPTVSCSGAMKFGVPMTVPSRVGPPIGDARPSGSGASSNIFAMPKSTSLTTYGSPSTGSSLAREEDVVRLEVAMDDPRRVRLGQRARRLPDDLRDLPRRRAARGAMMASESDSPSRNSMTMYGRPSSLTP